MVNNHTSEYSANLTDAFDVQHFTTSEVIVLTLVFTVVILISVCGNSMVCILLRFRYMRLECRCFRSSRMLSNPPLQSPSPMDLWADENLSSKHECSCGKTFSTKARIPKPNQYMLVTTFMNNRLNTNRITAYSYAPNPHCVRQTREGTFSKFSGSMRRQNYPRREKSITSLFLFNLSIADTLMAILCIPMYMAAEIIYLYWPFGEFMCKSVNYAQGISVFVSAFTHVLISWDRFVLVYFPLRPRISYRYAVGLIASIWLLASIFPLPVVMVNRIQSVSSRPQCIEDWSIIFPSAIPVKHEVIHFAWNVTLFNKPHCIDIGTTYTCVILFLQYFFPLSVICGTYGAIALKIHRIRMLGAPCDRRNAHLMHARHKMVKLLVMLAFLYGLSHLPRHVLYLHGSIDRDFWKTYWSFRLWAVATLIRDLSTCYNPFIYAWANKRFREDALHLLTRVARLPCNWCACLSSRSPEIQLRIVFPGSSTTANNNSSASNGISAYHSAPCVSPLCGNFQKIPQNYRCRITY